MPITYPTTVFASPPMPRMPLDSASCASPAAARQQPGRRRPTSMRDVDHDDQHQVERRGAAHQHCASVVCSTSASASAATTPSSLHGVASDGRTVAAAGGVSTTSTSSRLEKSTAGRTVMAPYSAAAALHLLHAADHEALRVDAVDARRSSRCRRRGSRPTSAHVLEPQRVSRPSRSTTPCARVRSTSAPAAALRSMSSCTFAARARSAR